MATWLPIALFIDRGFPVEPFADQLGGELDCRERVEPDELERVAALVTGAVPVGAEQVAPFPNLDLVLTCSIGVDHLDVAELRRRGLRVANTPNYCTEEVADHALACLLAGWRGLWQLGEDVRDGRWRGQSKTECGIHSRLSPHDEPAAAMMLASELLDVLDAQQSCQPEKSHPVHLSATVGVQQPPLRPVGGRSIDACLGHDDRAIGAGRLRIGSTDRAAHHVFEHGRGRQA